MRQFFVGNVPEFVIEDGVVHVMEGDAEWCMPLQKFRLTVAAAERVLEQHDAKSATVSRLPRSRGGHAASS